jgi:hypothetical protein
MTGLVSAMSLDTLMVSPSIARAFKASQQKLRAK